MDSGHTAQSKVSGSGSVGKENDLTISRLIRDFIAMLVIATGCALFFGWWYGYSYGKDKGKQIVREEAVKNGFGEFFIVDSTTAIKEFKWKKMK